MVSVYVCIECGQLRIGKLLLGKLTSDVDSAADGLEAFQAPAQPICRARCQHAQMFKKNSYSIVFMDCHMPVCDGAASCRQAGRQSKDVGCDRRCVFCVLWALMLAGFESTRLMRAWEASVGRQAVPIVAMSGDDLSSNKEACLACGQSRVTATPLVCSLLCMRACRVLLVQA